MSRQIIKLRKINKKLLIGLSIPIVLLILFFALFIAYRYFSPVFFLGKPLPLFPRTVSIYEMVHQDITREFAREMGVKFGLPGEITEVAECFAISNQQTHKSLRVYKATGAIEYNYDPFNTGKDLLPSFEEALTIAVKKLRETELLPTEIFTSNVMSGGSENIMVSIKYPVDGHPMGGISYTVRVGHLGQIVNVSGYPAKYTVYKQEKLKPVWQAYRELVKTKRRFVDVDTVWICVNDVTISYWRQSNYLPQDYLYPIYRFKGICGQRIHFWKSEPFAGFVAATFESPVVLPSFLAIPNTYYDESSESVYYSAASAFTDTN